eukprot:15328-Heterococcus_DN1.PRE.3
MKLQRHWTNHITNLCNVRTFYTEASQRPRESCKQCLHTTAGGQAVPPGDLLVHRVTRQKGGNQRSQKSGWTLPSFGNCLYTAYATADSHQHSYTPNAGCMLVTAAYRDVHHGVADSPGLLSSAMTSGLKKSDVELTYAKLKPKDKPAAEYSDFLKMLGVLAAGCKNPRVSAHASGALLGVLEVCILKSAVGVAVTAKLHQQGEDSVSRATTKVQKAACVVSRLGKRGIWQAALQLK